jgi:hypothetical protein
LQKVFLLFTKKAYKKLQNFSFSWKFSWKFSIHNADLDPGANWMCIQIRNTCGCYLKIIWKKFVFSRRLPEHKIICKKMGESENFRENFRQNKSFCKIFRENGNFLQKPFWEQKLFAKNFAKAKIFEKLSRKMFNKTFLNTKTFAKSKPMFAYICFLWKLKKGFSFQP